MGTGSVTLGMVAVGDTTVAQVPLYLAPRLAHAVLPIPGKGHSDWSYAWVPVVGPILGGVIGAVLYNVLFAELTKL